MPCKNYCRNSCITYDFVIVSQILLNYRVIFPVQQCYTFGEVFERNLCGKPWRAEGVLCHCHRTLAQSSEHSWETNQIMDFDLIEYTCSFIWALGYLEGKNWIILKWMMMLGREFSAAM